MESSLLILLYTG